ALKRRGYVPEAFIKYALSIGVTLNDKSVDKEEFFKALNAFNKDFIDSTSYRHFFVWNPVEITIKGAPEQEIELDLHPKKKEGGRAFSTKDRFYIAKEDLDSIRDGKIYRLMDCLNFRKEKGAKGSSFVFDSMEYDRFKEKGEKIIHWLPVPKNPKSLIDVEVVMDDNDEIKTFKGLGEEHMRAIEEGQTVQLERFGFCRLDEIKNNKLVFWFGHR
ncbi:MAG: hypothetical protein NT001_02395, partial [Candidatus Woesearchaeota archaeon]|nr:hypothetical protein [Candidatus Woesearchaeota archaeon]